MSFNYDNMSSDELRRLYEEAMKKEILIKYNLPTTEDEFEKKKGATGYAFFKIPDASRKGGRKSIRAKTLGELQEKVWSHEKKCSNDIPKTFREVYEVSIANSLKRVKPDRLRARKESIRRKNSDYRRFIAGTALEKQYASEITTEQLEEFLIDTLTKYDLRKTAVNNLRAILSMCFQTIHKPEVFNSINRAQYKDLIVDDVDIEKRTYTDEEMLKMYTELRRTERRRPSQMSAWFSEFEMLVAERIGEATASKWSDINWAEGYILIHRQYVESRGAAERYQEEARTKTKKKRKVPLTDDIVEFLQRLKAVQDQYYPNTEYLFPGPHGGRIKPGSVRKYFNDLRRRLEIPVSKEYIRGIHAFRRNKSKDIETLTNGTSDYSSQYLGHGKSGVHNKNYYDGIPYRKIGDVINNSLTVDSCGHVLPLFLKNKNAGKPHEYAVSSTSQS